MLYENKEVCLETGMIVKNYKEMCKIMGEDVTTGCSKKAQVANWGRYFYSEKNGQKFIIVEIYDEPFPTAEIHRRREGLYVQYIECLLMDIIANNAKNNEMIISRNKLYPMLGMVGEKYNRYYKDRKALADIFNDIEKQSVEETNGTDLVTLFDIDYFYNNAGCKLNKILTDALNSMSSRKLIKYIPMYIIIGNTDKINSMSNDKFKEFLLSVDEAVLDKSKETKETSKNCHLATTEEEKIILGIERQALNRVGCVNISEVIRKYKLKKYQSIVNEITAERCPSWKMFYPVLHIIHSDDLTEQLPLQAKEVRELSKEDQMIELNKRVSAGIENHVEKEYDKNQKKIEEYNRNDGWGTSNPMERRPFSYKKNFVEVQNKLIDYTVRLGNSFEGYNTKTFSDK